MDEIEFKIPKVYKIDFDKIKNLEDMKEFLIATRYFDYVTDESPSYENLKKFTKDVK